MKSVFFLIAMALAVTTAKAQWVADAGPIQPRKAKSKSTESIVIAPQLISWGQLMALPEQTRQKYLHDVRVAIEKFEVGTNSKLRKTESADIAFLRDEIARMEGTQPFYMNFVDWLGAIVSTPAEAAGTCASGYYWPDGTCVIDATPNPNAGVTWPSTTTLNIPRGFGQNMPLPSNAPKYLPVPSGTQPSGGPDRSVSAAPAAGSPQAASPAPGSANPAPNGQGDSAGAFQGAQPPAAQQASCEGKDLNKARKKYAGDVLHDGKTGQAVCSIGGMMSNYGGDAPEAGGCKPVTKVDNDDNYCATQAKKAGTKVKGTVTLCNPAMYCNKDHMPFCMPVSQHTAIDCSKAAANGSDKNFKCTADPEDWKITVKGLHDLCSKRGATDLFCFECSSLKDAFDKAAKDAKVDNSPAAAAPAPAAGDPSADGSPAPGAEGAVHEGAPSSGSPEEVAPAPAEPSGPITPTIGVPQPKPFGI